MSDAPTRAEEGRYTVVYEGDPAGNRILNGEPAVGRAVGVMLGDLFKAYDDADKNAHALICAAEARAVQAEAEVARLTAALKLCLTEMDWQIKNTNRCGDPNYECPLQDIHKPSDSHAEARHAARTALEAPHADN